MGRETRRRSRRRATQAVRRRSQRRATQARLVAIVVMALAALASAPAGAAIYWTNGSGSIGRADSHGHHVRPALIRSLALPCGVAVTRTSIYWAGGFTGRGAISRADLNGHHVAGKFIPANSIAST